MTNIIEILKGLGVEVPSEKHDDLNKLVSENYKTIVEFDKKVSKLETERDGFKKQAEESAETLKGFEGKDFDAMQKEVEAWKAKSEEAKKDFEKQIYDRDFAEVLNGALANHKFTSESAKESVINKIKNAGLKMSDGKILGLDDFIGQIKEKDAGAFVDEKQQELEQKKAKFTEGIQTGGGAMTKADINNIKDTAERHKAMLANKALYGLE